MTPCPFVCRGAVLVPLSMGWLYTPGVGVLRVTRCTSGPQTHGLGAEGSGRRCHPLLRRLRRPSTRKFDIAIFLLNRQVTL